MDEGRLKKRINRSDVDGVSSRCKQRKRCKDKDGKLGSRYGLVSRNARGWQGKGLIGKGLSMGTLRRESTRKLME